MPRRTVFPTLTQDQLNALREQLRQDRAQTAQQLLGVPANRRQNTKKQPVEVIDVVFDLE